jgi:hypothetical protein
VGKVGEEQATKLGATEQPSEGDLAKDALLPLRETIGGPSKTLGLRQATHG